MGVTGKDILNLTCAVKIVETTYKNGYYVFTKDVRNKMECALQEAIDKFRKQIRDN